MGWIKERIYVVGTEKGSKLDPRARELLESSRRAEGGGMEASIRGHGARHRTGSLSLSRPPPPPHSAFGRFSPFLFLVHGVAFSRWASNRNRDPSKASSVAPCTSRSSTFCLLALIRSSLFLILIPQFILNDLARSFAFFLLVFFELCILSMKMSEKGCNFSEDRDGKGLSRIFVEIFERFFPSIEFHETRTITFVTKFLKLESNHRELERKLQRIAKKFLFFSTTIITNYYNK